jgi:hypothetical protein
MVIDYKFEINGGMLETYSKVMELNPIPQFDEGKKKTMPWLCHECLFVRGTNPRTR